MIRSSITEQAISLPFTLDFHGNVMNTKDQAKIWADRVQSAIGTIQTQRLYRTSYGVSITNYAMDTASVFRGMLTSEIQAAFNAILPTLTLQEVDVTEDLETNSIYVDVVYNLPNQDVAATRVGIATITASQTVFEESL